MKVSETAASAVESAERTILFADVVDSTRLYVEDGDRSARDLLLTCIGTMAAAVEGIGGRVLERIGDEILCLFDTPEAAVHAASRVHLEAERAFQSGVLPRPLSVRVGFEHGSTLLDGDRVFGNTVHTAARLAALAKAGQTLTTKETLARLHPFSQRFSRHYDRVVLKGQPGERDVVEMLWDAGSTITAQALPAEVPAARGSAAEVAHGDRLYRVDAATPRLDMGRHSTCQLRVAIPSVSKLHARIVWERGKVRLEDLSTNGTYVVPDGGPPTFLHHDSLTLAGEGRIKLGVEDAGETTEVVAYRCLPAPP